MAAFVEAEDRGIVEIAGPDRIAFLQGLVSNDMTRLSPTAALWAAFLTPQGKYLFDFFAVAGQECVLLECERARAGDLARRLSMFKLRSEVTVADRSALWTVGLAWGEGAVEALGLARSRGRCASFAEGIAFVDPRLSAAGVRVVLPAASGLAALAGAGLAAGARGDWERTRMGLGLPDGSRDMEPEKAILLENGFDELGGCDWHKGCYMGQELTARTKYRGLIKKRLLPVAIDGATPAPGTVLRIAEAEAGEMRSAAGDCGLALIRLEALTQALAGVPITAGATRLTPRKPDWVAA